MTPRERVLAALNHESPDRVPIDLGSHRSSGIAAIAYRRLRMALKLPERPIRVYDPVQQLAIVDDDVLDRFGVDTIELGRGFAQADEDWADWTLPDGSPCQTPAWALPEWERGRWVLRSSSGRVLGEMARDGIGFNQIYWPYFEADDLDDLETALGETLWLAAQPPPGPSVAGPDGRQRWINGARRLRHCTQRAIVGLFGGSLLEIGQSLYGADRFLMLLAADPARATDFLDRLVALHLRNLEDFLSAVGRQIDIIQFVDDLGMQSGPQISPRMYRQVFQPRHAVLWQRAKELAPVKVMLHCCGGVRPLLNDLIDAGLDAINPVQVGCAGMDTQALKDEFGPRLTLWGGGVDVHRALPTQTPEEIRRHVRQQIAILRPGGGFVFQPVHNILAETPPENVIAMYDAALGPT